jgi:hypothetical protein
MLSKNSDHTFFACSISLIYFEMDPHPLKMARLKKHKKAKKGSSAGASKATHKGMCRCGSSEHKRTTHHDCPLNETNRKDKEEEEDGISSDDLSVYSDDSDGGGTPTGNSSDEDKVESWEPEPGAVANRVGRSSSRKRKAPEPYQAVPASGKRAKQGKGGKTPKKKKNKKGERNGKRSHYDRSLVGCLA